VIAAAMMRAMMSEGLPGVFVTTIAASGLLGVDVLIEREPSTPALLPDR
jgi:hypothetical protein